jgi:hypothetical protein
MVRSLRIVMVLPDESIRQELSTPAAFTLFTLLN